MKTFEFHIDTINDDKIDAMDKYLSDMDISFNIENDSIGFYEYHGHKSYDNGTNYIVINDHENLQLKIIGNSTSTEIELKEYANNLIEDITRHLESNPHIRTGKTIECDIFLKINKFEFDASTLTCNLMWAENQ